MNLRSRVGQLAYVLIAMSGFGCTVPWTLTPECWLIPEGYVGWLRLDFEIVGTPELPLVDGCRVVRVPPSGRVQTSLPDTTMPGKRRNRYFYVSEKGRVSLKDILHGSLEGNQIWDDAYVGQSRPLKVLYHCLFVGTEAQYKGQHLGCEGYFSAQ